MEAATKTFTVEEFVQAIEKDGLPQITRAFFADTHGHTTDDGLNGLKAEPEHEEVVIAAACAIGMAAINLGVDVQSLRDSITITGANSGGSPARFSSGLIEGWNDDAGLNYVQIAEKLRRWFPEFLSHELSAKAETYRIAGKQK